MCFNRDYSKIRASGETKDTAKAELTVHWYQEWRSQTVLRSQVWELPIQGADILM